MIDWNEYPYTNFHDLNLDWVLDLLKELDERVTALEQKEGADNADS